MLKKSPNSHKYSAMYRELAINAFLQRVGHGKTTLKIMDWFGSTRNTFIKPPSPLEIEWNNAPVHRIKGDNARGFRRDPALDDCDVALIQDVYQSGDHYSQNLSPALIKNLLVKTNMDMVYIISREFRGFAGTDSEEYDEGAWWRMPNGLVVFSPDPESSSYAPHPDINWLYDNRSIENLDIADLAHFGPYTLFVVSSSAQFAQELAPCVERESIFSNVTVTKRQDYLEWLPQCPSFIEHYLTEDQTILVHYPTFSNKNLLYRNRSLNGTLRDAVTSTVLNAFDTDIQLGQLKNRFPRFINMLQENTVRAILLVDRETSTTQIVQDLFDYKNVEAQLKMARMGQTPDLVSNWKKKCVFMSLAAFLLLMLKWTMAPQTAAAESIPAILKQSFKLKARFLKETVVHYCSQTPLQTVKELAADVKYDISTLKTVLQTTVTNNVSAAAISTYFTYFGITVAAPAFEEWLREYYPRVSFFYNHIGEGLEKYAKFGRAAFHFNFIFHSALFLSKWAGVSMLQRTAFHIMWNMWAMQAPVRDALAQVAQMQIPTPAVASASWPLTVLGMVFMYFYTQKIEPELRKNQNLQELEQARDKFELPTFENFLTPLPAQAKLKASISTTLLPTLTPKALDTLSVKINGESVRDLNVVGEIFETYSKHEEMRQFIYPILSPMNLMYRPCATPINLWNAIILRVASDPYKDHCHSDLEREIFLGLVDIRWQMLAHMRLHMFPTDVEFDIPFQQAIKTMPAPKRVRLIQAKARNRLEGPEKQKLKNISVKHDELINGRLVQDKPTIKPRAITQFSPEMLANQTKYSHKIAQVYHEMYNENKQYKIQTLYGLEIYASFVFASGYKVEDLNELMHKIQLEPNKIFYVVAGDDSLVFWGDLSRFYGRITEGDFTMYDHTQGRGPMISAERIKQRHMGVPEHFTTTNIWQAESGYHIHIRKKHLNAVIKFKSDVSMATGSDSTTNENSDHNIDNGYYQILNAGSHKKLSDLSLELGFLLKTRVHDSPSQGTFLKGWWQPTTHGTLVWLPLPSAILKMAKTIRDPCEIMKTNDVDLAYRQCLYALAKSPGDIPPDYPILGPFVRLMLSMSVYTSYTFEQKYKRLVVPSNYPPLDVSSVLTNYFYRYNITPEEVDDFHHFLTTIQSFPFILTHGVFTKLLVDYA